MLFILFIIIILVFIIYLVKNKIQIKFHTFLKKGFSPNKDIFGIYCYCGKQGSGKTYSINEFIRDVLPKYDMPLFANMGSLIDIDYTYINGIEDLLDLRSKTNICIVYDEIFTEISKLLKTDNKKAKDILDFLSQMRKRKMIMLTSCQEWRLLPLYFRLYCRYQINCSLKRVPFFKGILIKNIINADNIKWDDLEQDFVGELISNTITHTRLEIANSYDTYEQIGKYATNIKHQSNDSPIVLNDVDNDFWDNYNFTINDFEESELK